MWLPWVILGCVWAAATYQAWHAWQRGKMAEPANPLAAIASKVRVAVGYVVALLILAAGALASLMLAQAEHNRYASYAAAGTLFVALVGSMGLWRWFWKRRRALGGRN